MYKRNYSVLLIIFIAILMIALVIWTSNKKIRQLEKLHKPFLETK